MPQVIRVKHRQGETEEEYQERRERTRAEALELPADPGDAEPKQVPRTRTPRATSQKDAIAALLQIPNTLLLMIPATREDALNDAEAEQLTIALDHYQQKDERARRALHRMLAASTVAELLSVLLVLAIPRLARHGLIPQQAAQHLANFAGDQTQQEQPPYVTVPPVVANGNSPTYPMGAFD